MIINERGRMGKEVVVAHLKALSEHLVGRIELKKKKKETSQDSCLQTMKHGFIVHR
jgi:hypothetical protein